MTKPKGNNERAEIAMQTLGALLQERVVVLVEYMNEHLGDITIVPILHNFMGYRNLAWEVMNEMGWPIAMRYSEVGKTE